LRPELLTITHQPVFGNNQLQGEIDRVNYLGDKINIGLNIDGMKLTAVIQSNQVNLSIGNTAFINWPVTDGVLFLDRA